MTTKAISASHLQLLVLLMKPGLPIVTIGKLMNSGRQRERQFNGNGYKKIVFFLVMLRKSYIRPRERKKEISIKSEVKENKFLE
jgi:hypothetical protein